MNKITQNSCTVGKKAISKFVATLGLVALLLFSVVSFGQIAQRGAATTTASATATLTIAKPTGVVAGDVMLVNISQYGSAAINTAPTATGWTKIVGAQLAATSAYGTVLYRVADGTEGASFAFTLTNPLHANGTIVAFSGVDGTGGKGVGGIGAGPFDGTTGTMYTVSSTNTILPTSITTSAANAAVIMFGMNALYNYTYSAWSTTSPGALTSLYSSVNADTWSSVGAAWAIKTAAGATGAGTATLSGSLGYNGGVLIALKAAALVTPTITLADNTVATGNVTQNTTGNPIYSFKISPTVSSATLTGLTFTTTGTYASADVTNFKCYYQTTATLNTGTATLLSTLTTPGVAGNKTFPSFISQTIANGASGYIFITADVPCVATVGKTMAINAITASNTTFSLGTPTGTLSAGNVQTVALATPNNVTSPAASVANASSSVSWTNPTGCYSEIMIVAAPASNTGTPTGNGSAYTANLAYGSGTGLGNGFVVYKGSTSSQTVTALTNATGYYYKIFTRNGTNWSAGVQVGPIVPALTYCAPTGMNVAEGVTNVTFNTINNTTTNSYAEGYTDFTPTQSTTVIQSTAYNLSVSVNTGGNYTQYQKVWIDWNQDGVFNTTAGSSGGLGEEYSLGTAKNVTNGISSLCPFSITVPSGATLGTIRMRVSSAYNAYTTSCAASVDGEFEDYKLIIVAPVACTTPNAPTSLTFPSVTTTTINGSFTASSPAPSGYIVVRGSATAPSNSATYAAGFGLGGTVITGNTVVSNATTFSDSGLSPGTNYSYYVYAYNNTSCSGGPKYSLVLSDSQSTSSCPTFAATIGIDGATASPGNHYPTLTAAIADLSICGISQATVLELRSGYTSSTETYPITINALSGSSATNTLTIKPASGQTPSISGAFANGPLFKIYNNYTNIDGSNTVGGSTKDLSITNTSTTGPNVVAIVSSGITPVTNVTLKNTNITNGANTSSAVVVSDGTTLASAGYFNNITIQNNTVQKAYIGVFAIGNTNIGNGSGLLIDGNTMNISGTNSIRLVGIYVQGVDGAATISNNTIGNISNSSSESPKGIWLGTATNNTTISGNTISSVLTTVSGAYTSNGIYISSGSTTAAININNNTISGISSLGAYADGSTGIEIGGATPNVTIYNNKISNIKNSNPSGYGASALFLGTSSTTANTTIYNNMIWDVAGYGYASAASDNGHGIYVYSGAGYKIYYNSVNMTTNQTTGIGSAIYIDSGITTASSIDLRNNIFANNQTANTRYAIYSAASNNVFSNIDYNDYYSTGTSLGYLGGAQATLPLWQTATGKDANSLNTLPPFISTTNLHLTANACTALESGGTPISGTSTDIDTDTRSATKPDIGADEFTGNIPPKITSAPGGSGCGTGTVVLSATGSIGTTEYHWYAAATGGSQLAGSPTTGSWTTPSIAATTNYYVAAYNGTCESDTRTLVTITVNPVPTATVTNSGPYCAGDTIQLTGGLSGYSNYTWSGPNGYSVSGSSSPGINENFDSTVTGWNFSSATIATAQNCSGSNSINYNGNGQYAITPSVTNPSTLNFNYKRNNNATAWSLDVQISGASPTSQTSGPWTTVTTINTPSDNLCTSSSTIDLSSYSGVRYIRFIDTRTSGIQVRAIDDVLITTIVPTQSPTIVNATTAMSGTYTLTVTNSSGCPAVASTNVIVNPLPAGTLTNGGAVCSGTQPQLTFTASAGTGPFTLVINGQTYSGVVSGTAFAATGTAPTANTTYTLSSVVGFNCTNASPTASTAVTVNPLPAGTLTNGGAVCSGTQPQLTFTASAGTGPFTLVINGQTYSGVVSGTAFAATGTAPTANTTYTLSSVVGVNCTNVSPSASTLVALNPNTWTGATDNLWSVATNWSCGVVPNGATDVVIPSGTPTLNVDYTANSGTTLTINGSGSLIVNPIKTLTIAGTAAFNDRPITFESDASGTAMLGQVTGTVTGASNVTVKRYIPQGKRAFRFLTPGVTTTSSISLNWQQATHITGSTTGANGFDITVTGNPSMYTYNNQVASGTGWTAIPNTNATTLLAGTGYRMLIRGDRTPTLITAASQQNMNAAITLSATGTLKTGQVVLNATTTPAINNTSNTTTDSFSLVGNPYVSPIDWEALGKSGLVDAYYGFEPNFGTGLVRGKYVVYSTASHTNNESTSHIGRYIQSGQAFMVKNTVAGTPGTLTFNESNKASTQASVFKSANTQNLTTSNAVLRLSVYDPNELALASYPIDGTVAVFGTDFTNDLGYGDVVKLMSTGENLGLFKDSKTLAIEALAPVENNDELLVKTTQFQANKSYTFKVSTEGFASDVTAYLVDQYLNTQSAINMEAQTFATFATTTDVNSYGADRFKIVFSNTALGNDSFERKTMVIYPNPVTDNTFSISVPSNVTGAIQVTVYNLVGQEMYSTTEQAQQTLTIRPNRVLAQGVYIVQITNDGKTTNSKITIQQ